MRLHLIRHAPVRLAAGICYGRTDVPAHPLSPQAVAALRAQLGPDCVVVSSPLARCAELARRIAPAADAVRLDPRLREIDFGEWEMQPFDAIARESIDAWAEAPWTFAPPGGESAEAMSERVLATLAEWREQPLPERAVVAHGGPLRVLLGHLRGLPREEWLALPCEPGSIATLDVLS